ncbi:hypothetical protein NAI69_10290, partial [Francisella tularensis subsp. holarctica]|nr:hypothetical protein [Francisella tularensis subsp. holarctica]
GFISVEAFINVCVLLLSRKRYINYADIFVNKNTDILIATFFVFSLIYILTIRYIFSCFEEHHQFFIDALEIVIYPLLL